MRTSRQLPAHSTANSDTSRVRFTSLYKSVASLSDTSTGTLARTTPSAGLYQNIASCPLTV